ncbi:hypothetical protein CLIB1423_21S01728 [[Candida] railenensis]|uniref:Zn(2)-C6 fungal-type domain-containing protein n=1 Tax=[Candida] railenensis TaxID=45579 RepID=A0A9P0QVH8_9ASCO|nr:hypothetical protein CLIB1423_21S01728 [[Candida] railenensis]
MLPSALRTGDDSKSIASRQSHRACDACAVRKVKCGPVFPCFRCVSKKLDCTHLRQKKKSGPKNLHKKTLQSISEFTQKNLEHTSSSNGAVPDNSGTGLPSPPKTLTNAGPINNDVIDLLSLIKEVGVLTEIIESLTVSSLSANHEDFINVVREVISMPVSPPSHKPGSVSPPPTTPYPIAYLSKLCVSYTLCLLTLETILNMIELNQMEFKLSKPIEDYMYLQTDLVIKVNEYTILIDAEIRSSSHAMDEAIFYHHSLTYLHLYNYYQVCLIRLPQHRKHNKFLTLRQAVNYFQLLDSSQQSRDTDEQEPVSMVKRYEVYEILFIIERLNYFLLDMNCIMNNNMVLLLNERDFGWKNMQIKKRILDGKNQLSGLLKTTLENREYLGMFKFFNDFSLLKDQIPNQTVNESGEVFKLNEFLQYCADSNITAPELSKLILDLDTLEVRSETIYSSFMRIFTILIIFKVDMARTIIAEQKVTCNQRFLSQLIQNLMTILDGTDERIFKIKCHNYQLIPQFLTMLKLGIESLDQSSDNNIYSSESLGTAQFKALLFSFSCLLLTLSPRGYNLNQYIIGSKTLSIWFGSMQQQSQQQDGELKIKEENINGEYLNIMNNSQGGGILYHDNNNENINQYTPNLTDGTETFGDVETPKVRLSESSKDLLDYLYSKNREDLENSKAKTASWSDFMYYSPPTGA